MTKFLASVKTVAEAQIAVANGADFVDVKNPLAGALGAAPTSEICQIVEFCYKKVPVSATIGDLAMIPQLVQSAVYKTVKTGVDIVKVGVFPDGDARAAIQSLRDVDMEASKLAAVFFADQNPDFSLLDDLADAGCMAVIIDTAKKKSGRLGDHMTHAQLRNFISKTKGYGMLAGLAGSLRAEDIPSLLELSPDILGFRGALCAGSTRTDAILPERVAEIRALIYKGAASSYKAA